MRALLKEIEAIPTLTRFGRVARMEGLAVEVTGAQGAVSLGGQCRISIGNNKTISCEVVGFRDGRALVMPLGGLEGITLGARADFDDRPASIRPARGWLGRVLNGFGEAMDGKGRAAARRRDYPLKAAPPPATAAAASVENLILAFARSTPSPPAAWASAWAFLRAAAWASPPCLPCWRRNSNADAIVIGMIGERGREVKEFIEDDLGEEGLKRSVVVAATSDEAPLVRRQAAYVAMAVAEGLRDEGLQCPAADGFRYPLCHGPARDRPVRGRTAGFQGLYAHRVRGTAAADGARRSRQRGQMAGVARSPACLPCWWRATT